MSGDLFPFFGNRTGAFARVAAVGLGLRVKEVIARPPQ
jgi:hypothetical protein